MRTLGPKLGAVLVDEAPQLGVTVQLGGQAAQEPPSPPVLPLLVPPLLAPPLLVLPPLVPPLLPVLPVLLPPLAVPPLLVPPLVPPPDDAPPSPPVDPEPEEEEHAVHATTQALTRTERAIMGAS